MGDGAKAETNKKQQESSSTADKKSVASFQNPHFENGVIPKRKATLMSSSEAEQLNSDMP